MNGIDGNGFSPSADTSVLAERLQLDSGELKARARDPHAEIKTKIHRACIARLGAAFLNIEGSEKLGRVSEIWSGSSLPSKTRPSARASAHSSSGRSRMTSSATGPWSRFSGTRASRR